MCKCIVGCGLVDALLAVANGGDVDRVASPMWGALGLEIFLLAKRYDTVFAVFRTVPRECPA